jgi:hypothetical protein
MRSKLTTLEFNLSIDDYAEFSVYYTLHSRFGRKLGGWLLVSSIGPVAVLLSLALGIYPHLYAQAVYWVSSFWLSFSAEWPSRFRG